MGLALASVAGVPASEGSSTGALAHPLKGGLTYNLPVPGPTTPGDSDKQGGMWLINSAREGFVHMDLLRPVLSEDRTPFQAGNMTVDLDIRQDLNLIPSPSLPLTAVYYIVPGLGCEIPCTSLTPGPAVETGLVALFADRDFIVTNPFARTVIFRDRLDFTPTWTGEDPRSAGRMILQSSERVSVQGEVGPYHYFYAASAARVVVYEVSYVNAADSTPLSARVALDVNRSLSAPPFVYYNDLQVTETDGWRAGTGEAILLPLTNGTLEVVNVSARPRAWIPLALHGETATVAGSIGWMVAADFPYRAFLPLRSASYAGIAILDFGLTDPPSGRTVAPIKIASVVATPNPTWEAVGPPTSYSGDDVYAAFFDPADGSQGTTHILRINATGVEVAPFRASVPGRVRTFFEVRQLSQVFVFPAAGKVRTISTAYNPPGVADFAIVPPDTATLFAYLGALGGTLYGPALIPHELFGAWTDSTRNETAIFPLLAVPPLPPPAGNGTGSLPLTVYVISVVLATAAAVTVVVVSLTRGGRATPAPPANRKPR